MFLVLQLCRFVKRSFNKKCLFINKIAQYFDIGTHYRLAYPRRQTDSFKLSPVWHSSITAAQTKTLELLQQRAMKIIFPAVRDYTLSLIFANVDTLESRCKQRFFRRSLTEIVLPTLPASGQVRICYHRQIMPPKNIQALLMKTEKFRKSFLPYCLKHYDLHSWCELCITYKLLSQTFDISSRFFQHFAVILLYIVLIQLFLLPEQINHYYYSHHLCGRMSNTAVEYCAVTGWCMYC